MLITMASDRQGDLPALEQMSQVELQDLLNRQEKLLANKKFLRTLPDKGRKIEIFAEKLKQAIKERLDVDRTAQLFEKMDLGASCITEAGVIERIPDVTSSPKGQTQEDKIATSYSKAKQSNSIPNVFLKTDTKTKNKEPFLPYKSLKSTTIPEDLTKPSVPQVNSSTTRHSSDASRPPDYSAAVIPPLRHPGTQPVDLDEAARLLETQKKTVDDLLAQQAAQKLAERMDIKLGQYTPNPTEMRYRDREEDDEDEDSDDETDDEGGEEDVENA